jgi:hypothetical protein
MEAIVIFLLLTVVLAVLAVSRLPSRPGTRMIVAIINGDFDNL